MFNEDKVEVIINFFMNLFLNIVLNAVIFSRIGGWSFKPFVFAMVQGFTLGFFIGTIVPAKVWGDRVASAFKLKEGGLGAYLLSCAVLAFVMVTIMVTALAWLNSAPGGFADEWLFLYPMLLPVGYGTIVFCLPLVEKIAIALTSSERLDVVAEKA